MLIKHALLPVLLLISSSTYSQASQPVNLGKLEWLVGKWNRTNAKEDQTGVENWTKVSPVKLSGSGITLKGGDTIFSETLQIIVRNDRIYYVADVEENTEPVYFECTEITGKGIVFENEAHDFPKKITYTLTGNQLKVVVSGNKKSINFEFTKEQL